MHDNAEHSESPINGSARRPQRVAAPCGSGSGLHALHPAQRDGDDRGVGLAALIEEHGAIRNSVDLWTPYGGWIHHRGDTPYGYNITRQVLDPLPRRMTVETPGVESLPGHTATELPAKGRPGVVVEDRQRARRARRARLA